MIQLFTLSRRNIAYLKWLRTLSFSLTTPTKEEKKVQNTDSATMVPPSLPEVLSPIKSFISRTGSNISNIMSCSPTGPSPIAEIFDRVAPLFDSEDARAENREALFRESGFICCTCSNVQVWENHRNGHPFYIAKCSRPSCEHTVCQACKLIGRAFEKCEDGGFEITTNPSAKRNYAWICHRCGNSYWLDVSKAIPIKKTGLRRLAPQRFTVHWAKQRCNECNLYCSICCMKLRAMDYKAYIPFHVYGDDYGASTSNIQQDCAPTPDMLDYTFLANRSNRALSNPLVPRLRPPPSRPPNDQSWHQHPYSQLISTDILTAPSDPNMPHDIRLPQSQQPGGRAEPNQSKSAKPQENTRTSPRQSVAISSSTLNSNQSRTSIRSHSENTQWDPSLVPSPLRIQKKDRTSIPLLLNKDLPELPLPPTRLKASRSHQAREKRSSNSQSRARHE